MHSAICSRALWALVFSTGMLAQTAGLDDPADLIKQGQALVRQGKTDDALTLYRNALKLAPDSYAANSAAGVALDIRGDYAEARKHFEKAIASAPPDSRSRALRDMAMSYAFENDCKGAVRYAQQAYDHELAAKNFFTAAEIATEAARVCIEAGDLDTAEKWYRTGYETGLREPGIKPDRKNLWEFRWEHAQARLAARRGDKTGAAKHVEAARSVLAKGDNPQQQQFMPYLLGYVAYFGGDYKTALQEFGKSNQNDPFILAMMAQTHEKLGQAAQGMDIYRRIVTMSGHNPPAAYALPLAKKKLK